MSKKLLIFAIVLMSIALAGIITVQLFWIQNAIEQNERKFDQKVNDALSAVVKKLEHNEIAYVFEKEMDNNFSIHQDFSYTINGQSESKLFVSVNDTLVEELVILNEDSNNKVHWVSHDEDFLIMKKEPKKLKNPDKLPKIKR